MTARVRVVTPAEYETWIADQKQAIADANKQVHRAARQLARDGTL